MAAGEAPKSIRASLYIDGKPAENSIKGVTQVTQSLRKELNGLLIGTAEYNAKAEELKKVSKYLADAKTEASNLKSEFGELKENFAGVFESLGIGVGIGELVAFGKELTELASKASGIERAFARIGDTEGLLEKMRDATHGMVADTDLQKLAVEANNFNVPLEKMPILLEFAASRARDTGRDVTELTTKLVEGLGKKGSRSLNELGISSAELNAEMQKTPDRVEAIANIIVRRMADAGNAVDNFGDRMQRRMTTWENLKDKAAKAWASFVNTASMQAPDLDQEDVAAATNREVKRFGALEKLKDKELDEAINTQKARIKKLNEEYAKAQKDKDNVFATSGDLSKTRAAGKAVIEAQIELAGAQNALGALNNRKAAQVTQQEQDGAPGTVEYFQKQIAALKKTQSEISKTSDDWQKYEDKIKDLQKQSDAITSKKEKEDPSIKKAQQELKQYQTQLIEARDQLDTLIAKATKGTEAGLNAELKTITNTYDKIINKLKELNKNKFASAGDKSKNENLIKSATEAEGNAKDAATADFNYGAGEKTINDDAKRQADRAKIDAANGLKTKEQLDKDEYKIEQQRLSDLYNLQVLYGVDTTNVEKLNADNEIKEKTRVHDETLRLLKSQLETEKDFMRAKAGIESAKASLATTTFGVLNEIFGKNKTLLLAELALEKIIAIGKIEASEGVEIAGYWAKYALVPGGEIIAAGLSAAAVTRANLSIAEIVIAGIGEAVSDLSSGSSTKANKYAVGGSTDQPPGGYVSQSTLFRNSASGRPFVAGEAGREWIAPNWMVQSPRYANIISMLEGARQEKRAYAAGGFNTGNGNTPGTVYDNSELVQEMRLTRQAIQDQQVILNYHYFMTETAKIAQIQTNANAR